MELSELDQKIAESWNKHRMYTHVAAELNLHAQLVTRHVLVMRANGVDLEPAVSRQEILRTATQNSVLSRQAKKKHDARE
jgi:hypothetical protein